MTGGRDWRRGRESMFHGDRVAVGEDGKVLEMDGRDGCTTM